MMTLYRLKEVEKYPESYFHILTEKILHLLIVLFVRITESILKRTFPMSVWCSEKMIIVNEYHILQ